MRGLDCFEDASLTSLVETEINTGPVYPGRSWLYPDVLSLLVDVGEVGLWADAVGVLGLDAVHVLRQGCGRRPCGVWNRSCGGC